MSQGGTLFKALFKFFNKIGFSSVMVIGRRLFLSLFGEIHMRQGGFL